MSISLIALSSVSFVLGALAQKFYSENKLNNPKQERDLELEEFLNVQIIQSNKAMRLLEWNWEGRKASYFSARAADEVNALISLPLEKQQTEKVLLFNFIGRVDSSDERYYLSKVKIENEFYLIYGKQFITNETPYVREEILFKEDFLNQNTRKFLAYYFYQDESGEQVRTPVFLEEGYGSRLKEIFSALLPCFLEEKARRERFEKEEGERDAFKKLKSIELSL